MMNENWIKTKEKLPPFRTIVMARNPFSECLSWIDRINEIGKPAWGHDGEWNHADDFVSEWRWLTDNEYEKIMEDSLGNKKWRDGRKFYFRSQNENSTTTDSTS